MNNKINAGVLGFVIGDCLGVPVEFNSRSSLKINPVNDMKDVKIYGYTKGIWSDDTSMMLATIDAINNQNGLDVDYLCKTIIKNFLDWFEYSKYTPNRVTFGVGNTTKNVLIKYKDNKYKKENVCYGLSDFFSNGNGSLMRILPIAFYLNSIIYDKDIFISVVKSVSKITHAHDISIFACYIYVLYTIFLLNGLDKFKAYEMLKFKFKNNDYKVSKDVLKIYSRIIDGDIYKLNINQIKSTGYVLDTLEAVLWSFLNTNSYKEAVLQAVNLGDDTDTIGALVGGLAGIYYDYNSLPQEWINSIVKLDYIEQLVEKFYITLNSSKL